MEPHTLREIVAICRGADVRRIKIADVEIEFAPAHVAEPTPERREVPLTITGDDPMLFASAGG